MHSESFLCPQCGGEFAVDGYCPFDGNPLAPNNSQTLAEPSAHDTDDLHTRPHLNTLGGSAAIHVPSPSLGNADNELVGAQLDGRYRIERLIGKGGMGRVYLAHHIVIEKAVAIKVLRAEVAADKGVAKRFVREARAASRVGHPNIVDVTDFGTTKEGLTYQVMEYLEGQTLTELMRESGIIPRHRALQIIAQIARALGAAHAKEVVHRDLKPDNIFLVSRDGRDDFVKIVDFGIAMVAPREDSNEARLTQAGTVFGTPEYMSPEQASGRTDVDLRADIYSVGTILYEMLVGKVPHKGETTISTLAMQILDEPPPPSAARPDLDISKDLDDVVMRALRKEREERFQSMKALLNALEEVTTKTEFDLPLLVKQERRSANRLPTENDDTSPEVTAPTHGRHTRSTDPVFLRHPTSEPFPGDASVETHYGKNNSGGKLGIVLVTLLLVVAGVSAFVWSRKSSTGTANNVAMTTDYDARVQSDAQAPRDVARPKDAGPKDAEPKPSTAHSDARQKRRADDTHSTGTRPKRLPIAIDGNIEVTIITKPRGGRLIIKNAYAGSDGLNLSRRAGSTEVVHCRLEGYLEGTVKVKFDGVREVFLCRLRTLRKKRCVEGVKNPFDDCP